MEKEEEEEEEEEKWRPNTCALRENRRPSKSPALNSTNPIKDLFNRCSRPKRNAVFIGRLYIVACYVAHHIQCWH